MTIALHVRFHPKMQGIENYELDPNFAVVCSFLERFGKCFGDDYAHLNFKDLKIFLEASEGKCSHFSRTATG